MKWISNLLKRGKLEPVCVKTIIRDNLRLTISEYQRPCGHPSFFVEMFVQDEPRNTWIPIAMLHQDDVCSAVRLLFEGATFIDRTLTEKFQVDLVDD